MPLCVFYNCILCIIFVTFVQECGSYTRAPGPYPGVTIACVEAFYPGKTIAGTSQWYDATSVPVNVDQKGTKRAEQVQGQHILYT